MPVTTRRLLASALVVVLGCGGAAVRRFTAPAPLWVDPDMTPFSPKPAEYEAPEIWDTVDNTVFGALVEVLAVDQVGRARNANALDEVPASSWFENRIDTLAGDVETFLEGACTDPVPDPAGPWTVVSGKPDGANPGFMVEHASGKRYFFKPDGGSGGERQSIADFIGTRVYHAAGFNTACTLITYAQPSAFVLSPKAKATNFAGDKVPFTQEMLDKAMAYGVKRADGAVRAGLSQLLPGKPIGPWKDFGTRADDPNDVVPHEDRRELRGSYIFGAWLGHYDAREQNSLDTWVVTDEATGAGYVRHYQLDFGDCLGSLSGWHRVSERRGHAYEVDWPVAFTELLTLGLLPRPWRDPQLSPAGKSLGYFTAEAFTPDNYRTAYRYGPYTRVTEADAAWGARILARISPAMIHAVVAAAGLTDPVMERELERALVGRRDKLLRRYLTRLSPLTRPRLDDTGRLCVADARIEGGVPTGTAFTATVVGGAALPVAKGAAPDETCVGPVPAAAADGYTVVELRADVTNPLRVHLRGQTIVGLDRE
jgi:hypothetical protein